MASFDIAALDASMPATIPQMLRERVDQTPEREAFMFVDHGITVSYSELDDQVRRVAMEELKPHIEATPFGLEAFEGLRTKNINGLLQKSLAARQMVIHPVVIALCDQTLLPYAVNYQLNYSGIMHLAPGAPAQDLHLDGLLYPVRHPCPPMILPAMWALLEFTVESGGTQVVPGSHLWEREREPFEDEVLHTEMPPGSVLIYTGGTWHGGGRNRSQGARTGMALHYSLGWLRQEEIQYLANPLEVAKNYPERLRCLIGYDYGGLYLGFHNGDDPHRIFELGYEGPRQRTRPKIDRAIEKVGLIKFGEVEVTPMPEREGAKFSALMRTPKND